MRLLSLKQESKLKRPLKRWITKRSVEKEFHANQEVEEEDMEIVGTNFRRKAITKPWTINSRRLLQLWKKRTLVI